MNVNLEAIGEYSCEYIANYVKSLSEDSIKNRIELETVAAALEVQDKKNLQKLSQKIRRIINKDSQELLRVKGLYDNDKSFGGNLFIAGVDEVGRGPLAGPIVSAAVVLKLDCTEDEDFLRYINDSKKLSSSKREELNSIIMQKALAYSIASLDNEEIDKKGISYCNNEIFRMAVSKLKIKPDLILSDGYPIKNISMRNEYIIKGDAKSASIACASIIAKVYRDNLMGEYHNQYPEYGFLNNVGYGTKEHVQAILKYGITPIHRRSFLKNLIEKDIL